MLSLPVSAPLRGIMGGMVPENFDETRPMRLDDPSGEAGEDPEQTRKINLKASSQEAVPPSESDDPFLDDASGFAETMAVNTAASEPPPAPQEPGPPISGSPVVSGGLSPRMVTLLGVLLIIVMAAASGFAGYTNGINQRKQAQAGQVTTIAQEQFDLAVQDIDAKRYDLARQRLEYVVELDPSYPGVTDRLAEVLTAINTKATSTPRPVPTLTPTPDTRGVDEKFVQAQQDIANQNWTTAIDTLLSLRKADPNYQAVQVDGLLYIAFRNRGVQKILNQGDLEGGIYDLAVAERIGPLDADSNGYLNWARLYITGASFWELDWGQAVYYFAQVAPALPNLRDGSGWTATERYRLALVGYGDFLAENGDWCAAYEQFELALSFGTDPQVEEALNQALEKCSGEDDEEGDGEGGEDTPPPAETPVPQETTPAPTQAPAPEEPTPTDQPTPEEPTPTGEPPPEEPTATPGS